MAFGPTRQEEGSDESAGEAPVGSSVDTRLCDWMRLETRSSVLVKLRRQNPCMHEGSLVRTYSKILKEFFSLS